MTRFLNVAVAATLLVGRAIACVHRGTVVRYINARRRGNGRPEMDRGQRRLTAIVTGAVVVLVLLSFSSGGHSAAPRSSVNAARTPDRTSSAASASGSSAERGVAVPQTNTRTTNAVGEGVSVVKVVDGDTFALASGAEVRVLGIDSCEAGTPGGRDATSMAQGLLLGSQVTLTEQAGVDRDRYGRLLRYVAFNGQDFGEFMVRHDHTGVYEGTNDASSDYVARLYASDLMYATSPPAGRICGEDPPPVPRGGSYDLPSNGDDSSYVGRKVKGYVCRKTIFC